MLRWYALPPAAAAAPLLLKTAVHAANTQGQLKIHPWLQLLPCSYASGCRQAAHLLELWPQLLRLQLVEPVECALVVHGPHQREAVAVREQRLDGAAYLAGVIRCTTQKHQQQQKQQQLSGKMLERLRLRLLLHT
jgi:hypothetical protein